MQIIYTYSNPFVEITFARHFFICAITLDVMQGGGTIQLFSPCQLKLKQSTPSVLGFQNFEWNLLHFVL